MEDEAEDTPGFLEPALPREPLAWKKAVAGASSGVVCCAIFSPLDVVRTRLQVQGALGNTTLPVYHGITGTLSRIYREEGLRGWFRGFAPAILTVPVFWSLYFPLYDRLKEPVAYTLQTDTRHVPHPACRARAPPAVAATPGCGPLAAMTIPSRAQRHPHRLCRARRAAPPHPPQPRRVRSAGVHMFSAISAGLAINILTNPLWVGAALRRFCAALPLSVRSARLDSWLACGMP